MPIDSGAHSSHARLVLLLALAAASLPATRAAAEPEFYREYNPGRPPLILTAPPLRTIPPLPYTDPDVDPAGTSLVFYRVEPDLRILALRSPSGVQFESLALAGACCTPGGCQDLADQASCTAGFFNIWRGAGTSCADLPDPCPTGACCDPFATWQCYDAPNQPACGMEGIEFVPLTSCPVFGPPDPGAPCGCCVTASGCFLGSRGRCDFGGGTYYPALGCFELGC